MGGQPGRISMANILINTGIKAFGRAGLGILRKNSGAGTCFIGLQSNALKR